MARIFLDEMAGINQGILGAYGLPVSPFSTEDYSAPVTETEARPVRTRRKQNKPKPKRNDGIIRNHDSVWDYKFENGKLLTRRKKGNGNWIDISNNEKAVNKLESFTGRNISTTKNQNQNTTKQTSTSVTQPQQQSSTNTNRTTTKQVTQNQVSEPSINNAYELPGITVTAKVNNTKGKNKPLLSQEDLDTNGWHWASNWNDKATFNNGYGLNLGLSAAEKTKAGDKILVDSNGAIVPTSEVHRYINRGRIPLGVSDYDAQFYQPQSYASLNNDIRKSQDSRRNREFDRQRNTALGVMFGLPALGIAGATAPVATALTLGGSELAGAGFAGAYEHATGKSWEQSLAGNDPTGQFYAGMMQPGRLIGGMLGAGVGNMIQPYATNLTNVAKSAISNTSKNITGYANDFYKSSNILKQLNKALKSGKSINDSDLPVNVNELPQASISPRQTSNDPLTKLWGDAEIEAFEQEQAKAFWENSQPYEVKGVRKVEIKTKGGSRFVYVPKLGNKLVNDMSTVSGVYRFNQVPFIERLKHPIQSLPDISRPWRGLRTRTGLERFPVRINNINDTEGVGNFLKTLNAYYGSEYPKEHFFSIPYSIYP